jgi:hypothetical protein
LFEYFSFEGVECILLLLDLLLELVQFLTETPEQHNVFVTTANKMGVISLEGE